MIGYQARHLWTASTVYCCDVCNWGTWSQRGPSSESDPVSGRVHELQQQKGCNLKYSIADPWVPLKSQLAQNYTGDCCHTAASGSYSVTCTRGHNLTSDITPGGFHVKGFARYSCWEISAWGAELSTHAESGNSFCSPLSQLIHIFLRVLYIQDLSNLINSSLSPSDNWSKFEEIP